MSIRARIEDAIINYGIGRPEASLLMSLVAVAATSRRRYPGKKMGDREAFEAFLHDEMPAICRVQNLNVEFRGQMIPIERLPYKWFRCSLLHSAELPPDIEFVESQAVSVQGGDKLKITHGWLDRLAHVVMNAPENADEFKTPLLPIHLPKIDHTVKV